MNILNRAPDVAQFKKRHVGHQAEISNGSEPPLTREERRRVALASLAIQEQRFRRKIVEIEHERRALLASGVQ